MVSVEIKQMCKDHLSHTTMKMYAYYLYITVIFLIWARLACLFYNGKYCLFYGTSKVK